VIACRARDRQLVVGAGRDLTRKDGGSGLGIPRKRGDNDRQVEPLGGDRGIRPGLRSERGDRVASPLRRDGPLRLGAWLGRDPVHLGHQSAGIDAGQEALEESHLPRSVIPAYA